MSHNGGGTPGNGAQPSARPPRRTAPVDGEPVDGAPVDGEPVNGEAVNREAVDGEQRTTSPVVARTPINGRGDGEVPHALRVGAAWSWRLLVLAAATVVVLWIVGKLHQVVIPVAVALLLSALLAPAVAFLRRIGLHRSLATAIVLIAGLAVIAGTLTLVISQFIDNWGLLAAKSQTGLDKIQAWLQGPPLHLSDRQLNTVLVSARSWLKDHQSTLTTGAVSTAATATEVLAQLFLVLFTTFFFLRDGRRIWSFLVALLPTRGRAPIGSAGEQSWGTLVAYVRATVLVALIDAIGIGIGLMLLRIDLALALAALVFLGAFIPIVGATITGTVAVLVALVTHGPLSALAVIAVVIGVQQLEGHVLQPLIMGRAVAIHPLAVIMAIATGAVLAGIIGALVAVPIVAVLNTAVRHLAAQRSDQPPPPPPKQVVIRD
ncbi:MAG: AI-2E family transporter [Micromonosporaceae bacterium]|nr:AI-2E family transporter [Micromonosporaceae bacterium]